MSQSIRVMLVEDHPEYREVVELALERESDLELIGEFGTAERALRHLQDNPGRVPDVILLDLNLPGISGLDTIPQITRIIPDVRIIILTQSDHEQDVLKAVSLGAAGYLLKSATISQIKEGIRNVMKGGASLDARIASFVLSSLKSKLPADVGDESPITDRELEVLQLMSEGLAKKNIADQLSISPNTVVTHVTHIYEKLNAQNAPSAIAKAFRLGILKMEGEE
ncbi:response regulator [Haloferula chungangensis]|uniref:Response regulator n=1 Tax=Haloferula chungangensis TaxID=1048331 RepID=A0ABW2L7V6_9BACT